MLNVCWQSQILLPQKKAIKRANVRLDNSALYQWISVYSFLCLTHHQAESPLHCFISSSFVKARRCELTLLMSLPKVSLKLEPRISNWTWEFEPLSLKSIVPVRPVMLPCRKRERDKSRITEEYLWSDRADNKPSHLFSLQIWKILFCVVFTRLKLWD